MYTPETCPDWDGHDEKGLWVLTVFKPQGGLKSKIKTFKSDNLVGLIEFARSICNEIDIFYDIKFDNDRMNEKIKERDEAYKKPIQY